jgi:hypothetical protein
LDIGKGKVENEIRTLATCCYFAPSRERHAICVSCAVKTDTLKAHFLNASIERQLELVFDSGVAMLKLIGFY